MHTFLLSLWLWATDGCHSWTGLHLCRPVLQQIHYPVSVCACACACACSSACACACACSSVCVCVCVYQ